ncbi:MAG: hypothetical protein ACOVQ2_09745, partial [Flavobacterium sp.]
MAENNYQETKSSFSYAKNQIDNGYEMDKFNTIQKNLYEDYENEIKKIKSYKTLNNYTYKNDFKSFIRKRVIVDYLEYYEKLKEQSKALFPNLTQNILPEWKNLSKEINYNDEQLLIDENYIKLVSRQLIKNDT